MTAANCGFGSRYYYRWRNQRTVPIDLKPGIVAAGVPGIASYLVSGLMIKRSIQGGIEVRTERAD